MTFSRLLLNFHHTLYMRLFGHNNTLMKFYTAFGVVVALGFLGIYTSQGQVNQENSVESLLSKAYSLLSSDPQEATTLFERAEMMDPSNVTVRRQLGYLYESQGKHTEALNEFYAAEGLKSSDTIKLQIAYALLSLNRVEDANRTFDELKSSPYDDIRKKAAEGMVSASSPVPSFPRWWTHAYAVSYYDTRWNSWFYDAFVMEGYYLTNDKLISGYGIVSMSGDSRSSGGAAPQVFSDNSLVIGVGVRVNPFTGFLFDIQQGVAFDLIDKGSSSRTKGDFRAVATYSTGI